VVVLTSIRQNTLSLRRNGAAGCIPARSGLLSIGFIPGEWLVRDQITVNDTSAPFHQTPASQLNDELPNGEAPVFLNIVSYDLLFCDIHNAKDIVRSLSVKAIFVKGRIVFNY